MLARFVVYFTNLTRAKKKPYILTAGVPGGLVGYPRAYKNLFRDFNFNRMHILVGTFSRIKVD